MPEGATYTIEEHVEALDRTIDSLQLREPFMLVGHSLGALLAARYAAQHRREVAAPRAREPADLPVAERLR